MSRLYDCIDVYTYVYMLHVIHVFSQEICLDLCRIHPRCHDVAYGDLGSNAPGKVDCGLLTGGETARFVVEPGYVAFVS